jgi:cytochrome c556
MTPTRSVNFASPWLALVALASAMVGIAQAQEPPSRAAQLIGLRKATMDVLASQFGPLGGMAAGKVPYDATRSQLDAQRVVTLAGIATEVFPPESKEGAPTKAKADIWTNRAEFDGLMKDLQDKTAALVVAAKVGTLDALRPAVGDVGKACKSCHDKFKDK